MSRKLMPLTTCAVIAFITGCGYSFRPLTRADVKTIYVPVFENRTFYRGLEFDLTREVTEKIKQKTSLKIVDKDAADTILHGEIIEVRQRDQIRRDRLTTIEGRVEVVASVTWTDRRTNQVLLKRSNIQALADFIVPRRQDATSATKEAMSDLAEKIINLMEEAW